MNARPQGPAPIPVQATIRAALRVVTGHPRHILPPVAAVELPVVILAAVVTVAASLTWLKDEPLDPLEPGATKTLFLFLVTTGALLIFSQVARCAAVGAVAGVVRKQPISLTAALDPAFSRMGGLIAITLTHLAIYSLIVIPVVGWVAAPYLALRVALSFEAFMLEGGGAVQAIRRSWALTQGRLIRLIGVILLSALFLVGPALILSVLGLAVGGSRTQQVIMDGFYQVAQGVLIVPVVAFMSATTTLFYLQATENLDVQRDV